ncbi:Flp pilus assembly protein TadG [Devosia subaequoris]|uniref:Flp pilus assembly protein TadG n=1 Tax=Devosia subaequoris TaxID=395930 RepID=A0A7W6NDI4_9HYPH|nr:TadE/TadG family type IV pilus assembly protein [Devosia subaequoris]MBB4053864.1 Flp pilus assembly protein TadG [Devosia subaequoris]MCP1211390.1 pilus assembly protein [Devosia subaequoris]
MSGARVMLEWLKRIRRAEQGTAVVEFALVLPVMLFAYLGTLEASALITVDRKVQSVAGAIGDLVARVDGTIANSQMQDFFLAASGIMTPFESNGVQQVVTAVWVDSSGKTEVIWTRQYQGEAYTNITPHTVGSTFELPDAMIDISKGNMVIAAEASFTYTPLQGLIFDVPVNLYRAAYFLPRFGEPISIN